jgi:hypothetical protein
MRSGVPKSANARMNTRREAARIVGMHKGMTTLKNRRIPEQPRLSDASKSELSMFFSAPDRYRKTSGNSCSVNTRSMPLNP